MDTTQVIFFPLKYFFLLDFHTAGLYCKSV